MNEKIKDILRDSGISYAIYAAQRIEELEEENILLREQIAELFVSYTQATKEIARIIEKKC